MSKDGFIVNDDMFGTYVKIPTGASGDMHIYKVIGRIESNGYCDVPIMGKMKETLHSKIVPILNVIHCGVSEDTVIRVALSDCEIVYPPNDPLTISELREMIDKNIAYCIPLNEWIKPTKTGISFFGTSAQLKWEEIAHKCGKTWFAYRCKPEEAQHEKTG